MASAFTCPRCHAQIRAERGQFGQYRELNADGQSFHYVDCAGGRAAVEQQRKKIEEEEARLGSAGAA